MSNSSRSIPSAVVKRERRVSLAWIVPVIALMVAGWMGYRAWIERGMEITIVFDQAHGLRISDPVRFRGASVGEVRDIRLADDLDGLIITARLFHGAEHLARQGTRFWIVRPHVGLEGASGLDTIVGPRYIAASPAPNPAADASRQHSFTGLPGAPLIDPPNDGDLEITLYAASRGSMTAGAPLLYRQFRIGTIVSVEIAPDAGAIEARAHVEAQYVPLIRENSRFWDVGGYSARLGWRGLSVEVDSFQTFVTGGVAVATPPLDDRRNPSGPIVGAGHRFEVVAEPQKAWLDWEPKISLAEGIDDR